MAPPTRKSPSPSASVDQPTAGKIVVPENRGVKLVRACTVRRPAGELYTSLQRSPKDLATAFPDAPPYAAAQKARIKRVTVGRLANAIGR